MDQLHSVTEVIDGAPFSQVPNLISKAQQEYEVRKKVIAEDHKWQLTIQRIKAIEFAYYKNKVYVPTSLSEAIVEWYHKMSVHLGT